MHWLTTFKTLPGLRQVRELSVNSCWAVTAYVTMVGVEKLIVMPFLGRHLSDDLFGSVLLGRNTATILASGLFAGLHNLLLRRNQDWPGPEKALAVRTAVILGAVLTLAEILVLLLVVFGLGNAKWLWASAPLVAACAVWGLMGVLTHIWQTYWRMQYRLTQFYGLQIFNGLALLLIVPLYWTQGQAGIYWGWVAAGVAPLLATWLFAAFNAEWRAGAIWQVAEAKRMLRQMWVFVWGVVVQSLFQNLDRFIIGWLLGTAAVSTYFKVANTAYLVVAPVEPLSGVLLSMVAQTPLGPETVNHLRRLHVLMFCVIASVLVLGVLLGQPLTDLLYGAGTFAVGSRFYWIILVGGVCAVVSILLRGMLIVYVPAAWIVWHDTLSLVMLALASAILTWFFGLIGTATAVAITLAFRAFLSEAAVWLAVSRKLPEKLPV